MRTYLNKSLSLLLCAALLVALAGCSSKPQQEQQSALTETESAAPNSEEAASISQLIDDFTEVWATKWNELADDMVMSEQMGRAFLADLDGDGADELIFLYDDYLRYQGIVYRLGDSIEELGSFSISNPSLSWNFPSIKTVREPSFTTRQSSPTQERWELKRKKALSAWRTARWCRTDCTPPTLTAQKLIWMGCRQAPTS